MGIFRRRDRESMDPQDLLAQGHADMAASSAVPPEHGSPELTSAGFRLTVADVFMIKGRGTVLTGVIETGSIAVGWAVRVERGGQVIAQTVVEGIEQFRETTDVAHAGANVGLLVPALDNTIVQTGDVITG